MNDDVRIYAFCGRKRSGKGVLSNVLKEKRDAVIVTVANYLKQLCCSILECDLDTLNKKKDDGTFFSLYPDDRWFNIIHDKTNITIDDIRHDIDGIEFTNIRQMLQIIGTDCIRKHAPQWHVNCMKDDIKKYLENGKIIAVDDVRFPNERKAIEELGGVCYYIVRPMNICVSNHESETSLTWNMFDDRHIIINEDSLQTFIDNFKWHLENNFDESKNYSLFLSEKFHYTEMNVLFGQDKNELVSEIIMQNKDYGPFINYGIIRFKPYTKDTERMFLNSVYRKTTTNNNSDAYYILYNPLINENLKLYIT